MIKTGTTPQVGLPDDDLAATDEASETTYAHLGEEGAPPEENVYGMASGQNLMLALGSRKRPRLETPPPQAGPRLPASRSDYESIDFPRTQTLEQARRAYANRPREPLPSERGAIHERVPPSKPVRARDDDVPAGPAAKTPQPVPLKPAKLDTSRHAERQAQEVPSRRGPPTPPKPGSPPRPPLHDTPSPGSVAGPQLPTAIADAAAAIARRRNEV